MTKKRNIIAIGGGGFGRNPNKPVIEDYIVNLSNTNKPKITFFPTASAEDTNYIVNFYTAFAKLSCNAEHISLFKKTPDLESITKNSDIIYIGGGNTKSMLAVFREWNLDSLILNAYKNGTILAGVSAGAICWFTKGITDSWAHGLKVLDCMNVIDGVCCPHYDGEANRRPSVEKFLKNNLIDECLCIEDGAAVHFENEKIKHAISFYNNKNAYIASYQNEQLFENSLKKIDI